MQEDKAFFSSTLEPPNVYDKTSPMSHMNPMLTLTHSQNREKESKSAQQSNLTT